MEPQEEAPPTQQQDELPPTPAAPVEEAVQQAEGEAEVEPTKSVKNFWERLDEVFTQNSQLREQMNELLEQFPDTQKINQDFKSFIFQPERLSLCSNDDIQPSTNPNTGLIPFSPAVGHVPSEKFSNFRIRLRRPLRNVKTIQLLSAVIPNAIQNIPDEQVFFFWYRLRKVGDGITINATTANKGAWNGATNYGAGDIVTFLGNTFVAIQPNQNYQPVGVQLGVWWSPVVLPADTTRPNYYDINSYNIRYLWLSPTYYFPYEYSAAGNQLLFNRTFQDYNDIVNTLNFIIAQNNILNNAQNDISFQYDATLNKIIMVPNPANLTAGYYYLPCGYEDPNIKTFMNSTGIIYGLQEQFAANYLKYIPGYTLNLRLGFTWNGVYPNPFLSANAWSNSSLLNILWWYMRKQDPGFNPPNFLPTWIQNVITFNSYPDLVNTSCVRVYADFALGSTQDSLGSTTPSGTPTIDGLLSIVPVNTTNLGVGFYQNNFNNPLTKIPANLTEIGISMYTDQGLPYYLPNSASVLLELAMEYK